jgi:dihydrofolate reductase
MDEAIHLAAGADELMVMGGAQVYRLALPRAERLYMTLVHGTFEGDVFFPPWDAAQWREILREEHAPDARNAHACTFHIFERIAPATAGGTR